MWVSAPAESTALSKLRSSCLHRLFVLADTRAQCARLKGSNQVRARQRVLALVLVALVHFLSFFVTHRLHRSLPHSLRLLGLGFKVGLGFPAVQSPPACSIHHEAFQCPSAERGHGGHNNAVLLCPTPYLGPTWSYTLHPTPCIGRASIGP